MALRQETRGLGGTFVPAAVRRRFPITGGSPFLRSSGFPFLTVAITMSPTPERRVHKNTPTDDENPKVADDNTPAVGQSVVTKKQNALRGSSVTRKNVKTTLLSLRLAPSSPFEMEYRPWLGPYQRKRGEARGLA